MYNFDSYPCSVCSSDDKMTEIEEAPDMEMKMSEEETKGNFVSDAH